MRTYQKVRTNGTHPNIIRKGVNVIKLTTNKKRDVLIQ